MKRIPLSLLQHQFSEAIRSGSADQALLESIGILNQAPIAADDRIGIYQTAFEIRMYEALEEDFPEISNVLGDEEFAAFSKEYLAAYPSQSWTLAELGDRLPEFAATSRWISQLPFLADLAHLEWSRVLSEHAANSEQLDILLLSQLQAEEHHSVIVALAASVQLLRCEWAVHRQCEPQASNLAIYRDPSGEIRELELSSAQWTLMRKLATGRSVGEIVNDLSAVSPQDVTAWFADWTSKGIIIHRRPGGIVS